MSSLHESRSRHLLTLSHAVHLSVGQKHENRTAPGQDYRGMGSTVQPNLAIAFWVRNVCQTQTPFSQTTTAALSVGRPCAYTHVRNKHQCCYISIFTLLSLFWDEKKNMRPYFLSNPRIWFMQDKKFLEYRNCNVAGQISQSVNMTSPQEYDVWWLQEIQK